MKRTLRVALAAAAVTVSLAPVAPASAMVCHESIRPACETLGLVCRTIADHPKLGVQCAQLG